MSRSLCGFLICLLYIVVPIYLFGIKAPETPLPPQFLPIEVPITKSLYDQGCLGVKKNSAGKLVSQITDAKTNQMCFNEDKKINYVYTTTTSILRRRIIYILYDNCV